VVRVEWFMSRHDSLCDSFVRALKYVFHLGEPLNMIRVEWFMSRHDSRMSHVFCS